jgi:hypothetical protein
MTRRHLDLHRRHRLTSTTYKASVDFSATQGFRNWYYLYGAGTQMTFNSDSWRGNETYLMLWAGGLHGCGEHNLYSKRWRLDLDEGSIVFLSVRGASVFQIGCTGAQRLHPQEDTAADFGEFSCRSG